MADRLVAVNDADYRLPPPVRQGIAADATDSTSELGGAIAGVFARRVSVDVRDFGAVGDGATDDTAAIRAAVAYAAAAGGGDVSFPAGVFLISGEILITRRIGVHGRGHATVINASALPAGEAALRIGGTLEASGVVLDGLDIVGAAAHTTDGVFIGNRTGTIAASDFSIRNVRVRDFRVGIVARYAWDGVFSNVRVHLTNRPITWGPQVNSVQYTGAFSSFTESAIFSVCETIQFDRLDLVNFSGTGYALNLYQSSVTINTPYFENLARLAQVGGAGEGYPSSFLTRGGRVTGDVLLGAPSVAVDISMPWVVERGVESDTRRLTVSNNAILANSTRRIRVDVDQAAPLGVKTITSWDGRTPFPYPAAYGGSTITSTDQGGFYRVTSPSEGQGFTVTSGLTVGKQYVFSYRIRKTSGATYLRVGASNTATLRVVTDAASNFEVVHIPFLATETSLRVLFGGDADVQFISVVEGLRFLDR